MQNRILKTLLLIAVHLNVLLSYGAPGERSEYGASHRDDVNSDQNTIKDSANDSSEDDIFILINKDIEVSADDSSEDDIFVLINHNIEMAARCIEHKIIDEIGSELKQLTELTELIELAKLTKLTDPTLFDQLMEAVKEKREEQLRGISEQLRSAASHKTGNYNACSDRIEERKHRMDDVIGAATLQIVLLTIMGRSIETYDIVPIKLALGKIDSNPKRINDYIKQFDARRDSLREINDLHLKTLSGKASPEEMERYWEIGHNFLWDCEPEEYESAFWLYLFFLDTPLSGSILFRTLQNKIVSLSVFEVVSRIVVDWRIDGIESGDPLEKILSIKVGSIPFWIVIYYESPEILLQLVQNLDANSPMHSWWARKMDGGIICLQNVNKQCEVEIDKLYQRILNGEKSAEIFEEYCQRIDDCMLFYEQSKDDTTQFLRRCLLSLEGHDWRPSILSIGFQYQEFWNSFQKIFWLIADHETEFADILSEILRTKTVDGMLVGEKIQNFDPEVSDDIVKMMGAK